MFYHLVQQPEAPQALDGAPKPPEALPVFECISAPAAGGGGGELPAQGREEKAGICVS